MKTARGGGKRVFDVVAAAVGVALLLPLLPVVAILIKLEDGGPVFFRQVRIGRHGVSFRMWKLRTMRGDAEGLGGPLTVGRDPRTTRVGGWLRRTKLDELPQLLNVLTGDMSLVGPRPEVSRYVALYDAETRAVLELIPGITDLASIAFRDENELLARAGDPERFYIDEIMPAKIRLNLDYAARATVLSDLLVILKTVWHCFRPRTTPARLVTFRET